LVHVIGAQPPRGRWHLGLLAQPRDDVENAQHLAAVANHLPIARLSPPEHAVSVHDERRPIRHVAVLVQHAVRADDLAMDIAQQRERKALGSVEGLVAERAVSADRDERGAAVLDRTDGLAQAGELGRSDPAEIVAVERDDEVSVLELFERDVSAEGRGQRKTGRGLGPPERDHGGSLARDR